MKDSSKCPCGNNIPDNLKQENELSPSMYYVNRFTCSLDCHNKWVLGQFNGSAPVGKGWVKIINKLHEDIKKLDPNYQIEQVKQKYGGLRYYANYSEPDLPLGISQNEVWSIYSVVSELGWMIKDVEDPDTNHEPIPEWKYKKVKENYKNLSSLVEKLQPICALIRRAEDEAEKTCEWCGEPGTLDKSEYWLLTLCDQCKNKRQEEKNV